MAELIEVLVIPLSLSIHEFMVNILAVDDKIVLNVEDEVPGIGGSLRHFTKLVEVSADGGLALFELVGDIMDDVTEVLNSVEHSIELAAGPFWKTLVSILARLQKS